MTDFRALTDEILQLLDYYIPEDDRPTCWDPWRERARAALTEPESEWPTDDELNALWNCCGIADEYGHHEGNFFDFARAVLARWGK